MKKLKPVAVLLLLTSAAFAGCRIDGVLRLAPPYNQLECTSGNKTFWAVKYMPVTNSMLVMDPINRVSWLLPMQPLTNYQATTAAGNVGSGFSLQTGAYEDEHRVPVHLQGN
jgi:hypothetical protein